MVVKSFPPQRYSGYSPTQYATAHPWVLSCNPTTDPLDSDSDHGGSDGNEDANANGRGDGGERDLNDPSDDIGDDCDSTGADGDCDEDGLTNCEEAELGSDPRDADTDGGGLGDAGSAMPATLTVNVRDCIADVESQGGPTVEIVPGSSNEIRLVLPRSQWLCDGASRARCFTWHLNSVSG